MISDAIAFYLESLIAFWQGLVRGGHLHLIFVALAIWWFLCRKGRCCRACRHCGCRCGRCRCEHDEEK